MNYNFPDGFIFHEFEKKIGIAIDELKKRHYNCPVIITLYEIYETYK
jgi:hypothetical protein